MRHLPMPADSLQSHQADMRLAYACGFPGVLVSGIVWLAAAATSLSVSATAGVWVLLVGGMAIFPLSFLACRAVGATAKHAADNPLRFLAMEGTVWLMAGILISLATTRDGFGLFFPVMLLVIGSRYLTFHTLYGLRHYWLGGAALCIAGFAAAMLQVSPWVPAAAGGCIEIALAAALLAYKRHVPSTA